MNLKSLIRGIIGLAFIATAVSSLAATGSDLLGEPAPADKATRTISIDANTRYVNVEGGETIRFEINGKAIAWVFDGSVSSFDLERVMPNGLLDHKVMAYVSPNPLYSN
ncbi:CzcE family metal-binding protein [Undibacterium terreum]|uniref:Heavy-metal resistance protein CzcE n=1 Tax=Undibacterium terreum TaxID=1224302 RepID=A0A916XAJ6_9BURK|nr:CzcE family metal-binding protein [Undibacterium terreum]GGC57378.1 hypothetical protein GCM10011396_00290 [Undibacterium terreum]